MLRMGFMAFWLMLIAQIGLAKASPIISPDYINAAILEAAQQANVPHELLRGICQTESNLNPHAFSFNDGGNGNHAYGMCQVLRITAEEFVGPMTGCEKDFRSLAAKDRRHDQCKLFGPKVNALAAARYLRFQIDRYKGDLVKATAAYNAGSLRTCGPSGRVTYQVGTKTLFRCIPGGILNQEYVNRVKKVVPRDTFAPGRKAQMSDI